MTKKYKCRVEYLESTGTQYIDTGFVPTSDNFQFEIKMLSQNTSAYLGYRSVNSGTATGDMRWFFNYSDGRVAIRYGNTTENSTLSFNTQTTHKFYFNGSSLYVDDVNYLTTTKKYATPVYKSFYLFSVNTSGYYSTDIVSFVGRIYYTKIWDNNVLVRDFIPVLDNSGRPAMYDQVSGQLFYNQGSGEFTYGRQIIPVEYLESTGTQYIDTGFKGKNNLHYKAKVNFPYLSTGSSNGIGGEYLANASAYIGMVRANGHYTYLFNNTAVETTTTIYTNTDYEIDSVMNSGSQVLKVNGETISTGTLSGTFTSTRNIFLYAVCSTNDAADVYGSLKMYYCQIYDNDTLVRDFIPCIDENLTPFMFDKVNGTVYLNAGTGQFKVGPNVEKVWGGKKLRRKLGLALATLKKKRKFFCEVEYLKSDGLSLMYITPDLSYFPDFEVGVKCDSNSDRNATLGVDGNNMLERSSASNPYWTLHASGTTFVSNVGVGTYADAKYKDGVFSVNGVTVGTKENTFQSGTLCLFKPHAGNNNLYKMSIYFFKAWDSSGILVRDMIPVLDWNYVPCMYDRVTEQLFYNAGTGTFQYGREIHPVDYLESTGVEYVDTGIKFDGANTKIELKTYEDSLTRRHSICGDDGNFFYYFRGTGNWAVGYNGTASNIDLYMSVGDNVFVMDKNNVYVNDVLAKTYTATSNVSSYNALLFNRKTSLVDNGAVTMYYCKIWDNDVLVRDYIPAIDENGVGFMFDRVSHTIYDNAGTGAFGYSGREVEYLQSDGARAILAGVTVDDTCGYDVKWMALNADDRIIMGTKGSGDSRWVLSGSNNPNVNLSWNTSYGSAGLGLNKIQTAQMNYLNDRKRILNGTPLADITTTLASAASTYNVGIFAGYWGASTISLYSTCRLYYAKISKGTELIRDFIPMVKDGSPCLYDKVGRAYYFGIGTGSFTRGKIVEPEYE